MHPYYVHALAGLAKVRAARTDYDGAISLYSQVVARYPIPEYVIALGDVYRAAGRQGEAAKQYDLVSAIDRLYKANGVNTDLQMALFFADHDLNLHEALRQARAEYERRGSIQAADILAWALYKSGQYEEALTVAAIAGGLTGKLSGTFGEFGPMQTLKARELLLAGGRGVLHLHPLLEAAGGGGAVQVYAAGQRVIYCDARIQQLRLRHHPDHALL